MTRHETPIRSLGLLLAWTLAPACSSPSNDTAPGHPDASIDGKMDGPSSVTDAGHPDARSSDGEASADREAGATCTTPRPQLSASEAASFTTLVYLAKGGIIVAGLITDNWDPTAGVGDVTTFVPTFTVATTGGTYTTIQAAIDAAVTQGGTDRIYIAVSPGTYREVVCVRPTAPPITLYGTGADPTQTVIAYDNYNGEATDAGTPTNACTGTSAGTYGTAGSATFAEFADQFEAANLTFSNDTTVATLDATSGSQAVALMTQADKIVLDDVQVLGHQDTLYLETPSAGTVVRVYVKDSTITGDVDFVFGGATSVLDGCTIEFVNDRKSSGSVLAPDTDARNPYGILVTGGSITGPVPGVVGLGRAWDRSCVSISNYVSSCVPSGAYPNGQAVVRGAMLGDAIAADPWGAAATTMRPFCNTAWACAPDAGDCPANRLFEYENTGPGSAP